MWLWIRNHHIWHIIWTGVYGVYIWNKLSSENPTFGSQFVFILFLVGVIAIWSLGLYVLNHWDELTNRKYKCLLCGKDFFNHSDEYQGPISFMASSTEIDYKLCFDCKNKLISKK